MALLLHLRVAQFAVRGDGARGGRSRLMAIRSRSVLAYVLLSAMATWLQRAMDRCREQCGADPRECVPNDEGLTQYGKASEPFHNNADERKPGLSLIRGTLTEHEACARVVGARATDENFAEARARYTTVGRLRDEGFAVVHSIGRAKVGVNSEHLNAHVSVVRVDRGGNLDETTPWPIDLTERFDSCFNETEGGHADES